MKHDIYSIEVEIGYWYKFKTSFVLKRIAYFQCFDLPKLTETFEINNSRIIVKNNLTFNFQSYNFRQQQKFSFKNLLFENKQSKISKLFNFLGYHSKIYLQNLNVKNLQCSILFHFELKDEKLMKNDLLEIIFKMNYFQNITSFQFIFLNSISTSGSIEMTSNFFKTIYSEDSCFSLNSVNAFINKNYFIENTAGNGIFQINTFFTKTIFKKNIFIDNFANKDKNCGVINTQSEFIQLNKNIFNDPATFELVYFISKDQIKFLDISKNYWYKLSNKITDLIQDGLTNNPSDDQLRRQPFDTIPIEYLSEKCGFNGWMLVNNVCNFIHSGPMTLNDANEYCLSVKSTISSKSRLKFIERMLNLFILNQSINKNLEIFFWFKESFSNKISDKIHKPFICERIEFDSCLNDCSGRGICSKRKCFCNPGWEGTDCLKYHCNDKPNCQKNGECIGPNICKCNPGWTGSSCSISLCPRYTKCRECTKKEGCGWCDSKKMCLPGKPSESLSKCKLWFYNNCFSMAPGKCSSEIFIFNCNKDFCSKTHPFTSCSQCLQLSTCFKQTNENCRIWDERKCPKGFVPVDFLSIENEIQLNKNVKRVESNEKFFNCQKKPIISKISKDNFQTFYIRSKNQIKENNIYLNNGENGIRHRIIKVLPKEDHSYKIAFGRYAHLDEYFNQVYGKFKGNFFHLHENTNEKDFRNFELTKQNYIKIDDGKSLKCLGNKFSYLNSLVQSFFILSKSDIQVEKGEILIDENNLKYIEKITRIQKTKTNVFVESELVKCSNIKNLDTFKFENIKDISSDFQCSNGNDKLTLHHIKTQNFKQNLYLNSLIKGKKSSKLLGYVIKSQLLESGWKMIEIIHLKTLTPNLQISDIITSNLQENSINYNSNIFTINKTFQNLQTKLVSYFHIYFFL